ncbi:HsdM family class I SAM-dependent methyltransferase [Streptomyces poonensis]|uniref:HsdM family class I SAM-dependent methyltransferase n=1 Tax=Streptomyces poonensis TaxID=68255 RepID=UPI003570C94B
MRFGNVLREDTFGNEHFDYLLAHPPFGLSWRNAEERVRAEYERGYEGRFGAGLPRVSDGSLLFLQHMLAKMKPADASGDGGSRVVVLFSGSPMQGGATGSGESDIRRWIIENDWLEGIVALPDQLFYTTGISTYLWVLSNRKKPAHQGRVALVKAQDHWQKTRQSSGSKRKYLGPDQLDKIVRLYEEALSAPIGGSPPATRWASCGTRTCFTGRLSSNARCGCASNSPPTPWTGSPPCGRSSKGYTPRS